MKFFNFVLNEDARTEWLESASILGSVCDDSLIKKIDKVLSDIKLNQINQEEITDLYKEVVSLLSMDRDWSPSGVKQLKDEKAMLSDMNLMIDLFSLMKGMNSFMKHVGKKIVGKKPYFIHDKIPEYYKLEKELLGEIKGSKANTADVILSDVPLSQIFDGMRQGMTPDKNLEYITLGNGAKIIQVSLKKSETGAQLGKITSFLKGNLGYGDDIQSAQTTLNASYENLKTVGFINEGFFSKLKDAAIDIWDKFTGVIKKVLSSFSKKWLGIFNKQPDKQYVDDLFKELGGLNEGTVTGNIQKLIDNLTEKPEKIVSVVNNSYKKLKNATYNNDTILLIGEELAPYKKFSGDNKKAIFTLISNYLTFRTLYDMVSDEKNIGGTVNRLVAEMMFGGTKLPLWKVYGDYGTGHSYVYLGTIDTFMKERTSAPNIEVLGIRINKEKDYYIISILMLDEIKPDGKYYIGLRTGTNSSSRISFVFEGTSIKGPYPLEKPFDGILKGSK